MKKVYRLNGLDCPNCAVKLEEEIKKIDEIDNVVVDFMKLTVILDFSADEKKVLSKVKRVIHQLEPDIVLEETILEENLRGERIRFVIGLAFFVLAMVLSRFHLFSQGISFCCFVFSYLITGGEVVWKAFRNIRTGKFFDENFLMSIATIGAFLIGEYPEAVAVILFYQLGEFFQKYAVNHSRKSIANLMDIRADYANVEQKGDIIRKAPDEVNVGEVIVIKPGEKVPLDGIVQEGISFIDTKALTGEAIPRKVMVGDTILSGCVNQDGLLKVKVTCEYQESTVNKILNLIENASSRKSKSENFITKFAKYYTPIVVGAAFVLAIIPPLLFSEARFSTWIYRALSFLVVSCPCALVISVPLSFFGGIGATAKAGILVKGSNYLEALSKIDTMVFDKTGTLTEGVFEVQLIQSIGISEKELLKYVAYAESFSSHPIAVSIRNFYGKDIEQNKVTEVKELAGFGIVACVSNKEILVGNEKLMVKNKIKIQKSDEIGTILYVAMDKKYVGYIVIADKIKKNTFNTLKTLKKIGIHKLVMLTGDKIEIGEAVANELKMDAVYAGLLPNQKVEKLEELLQERSPDQLVAFVGDGMNDAAALALCDVGIAMGGMGSDAAIEAADVVIMTDDPFLIVEAISISRKTLRTVRQNVWLAIVIKISVLIFSALGISTMWMAVFADVGVTVLAVLNALRLLKIKSFSYK